MKYRYTALVAFLPMSLLLMSGSAETAHSVTGLQEDIRYNFEYKCGGERIVISHCRKDSDQPGFAPTQPDADYCQIYYPDRPKGGGFTAMGVELRGDMIKKLQACGALDSPTASSNGDTQADDYMTQGDKYFEAKDYPKAIESYKRAADLDPSRSAAFFSLGTVYFDQKEYQLSASAFKKSVTLKPNALGFVLLGSAYRHTGKSAEAVAAFRSAIRLKPETTNLVNAYYGLGAAYVDIGRKEDALQAYRTLQTLDQTAAQQLYDDINKMGSTPVPTSAPASSGVKANTNSNAGRPTSHNIGPQPTQSPSQPAKNTSAGTYLDQGNKFYEAEDFPKAAESFKKALAGFGRSPADKQSQMSAYIGLVSSYFRLKQYALAVTVLKQILIDQPDNVDALTRLGSAYRNLKQYPNALTALNKAISLEPDYALPHYELGELYIYQMQYSKAPAEFQKALSLKPEDPFVLWQIGLGLDVLEHYEEALQAYRGALALKPTGFLVAALHSSVGETYLSLKQYDKAIASLQESLHLDANQPDAYKDLGVAYSNLKHYPDAVKALQQSVRLRPDNAEAQYELGSAYQELKQYAAAVPPLREALRLKPDDLKTLNELGKAYMFSDQYPQALAAFQQAIRLKPDEPVFHYHLGLTYCFMGRKSEAVQVQRGLQNMDKKLAADLLDTISKME